MTPAVPSIVGVSALKAFAIAVMPLRHQSDALVLASSIMTGSTAILCEVPHITRFFVCGCRLASCGSTFLGHENALAFARKHTFEALTQQLPSKKSTCFPLTLSLSDITCGSRSSAARSDVSAIGFLSPNKSVPRLAAAGQQLHDMALLNLEWVKRRGG
jgi:hypothetical protein